MLLLLLLLGMLWIQLQAEEACRYNENGGAMMAFVSWSSGAQRKHQKRLAVRYHHTID